MSFYSTPPSSYKPQVRVEGFHLPSPDTPPPGDANHHANPHAHHRNPSEGGPGGSSIVDDLFSTQGFAMPPSAGADPFRKFPSSAGGGGDHPHHDFGDDLVSLMGADRSGTQHHHQQGSSGHSAYEDYPGAHHQQPHRTHNIFDVSSPIPMNGTGPQQQQPGSQPGSLHSPSTSLHDYHHHQQPHHPHQQHHHHHPHHFNSTLPALNSSMRYENPENNNPPPPPSVNNPLTPSSPHPPPSSYSASSGAGSAGLPRHTPSPTIHAPGMPGAPPIPIVGAAGRSRSRSRPPSQGGVGVSLPANISQLNSGGVGPARTTRQRRGNSISGTSPPPLGSRPHAIVIPGRGGAGGGGAPMSAGAAPGSAGGWFGANSTSEYSLPTPESLNSHSFSHSTGYTPFSLSPPPGTSGSNNSATANTGSGPNGNTNPSTGGTTPTGPPSTSNATNSTSSNGSNGGGSPNSDLLPPLHHALSGSIHHHHAHHAQHHPGHHHHQHHPSFSSTTSSSYGGSANGFGGGSPPGGYFGGANGVPPTSAGLVGVGMVGGGQAVGGPVGVAMGGGAGAIGVGGGGQTGTGDKQALLANEKRRRRRESHNAVERRRRDNINEKISELATLIPECMLDGNGPPNAKDPGTSTTPPITEDALVPHGPIPLPSDTPASPSTPTISHAALKKEARDDGESLLDGAGGGAAGVVKANKGMILRKSVEYIRYLQQLVTAQGARNRELEGELRKYRGESPLTSDASSPNGSTNPNSTASMLSGGGSVSSDMDHDGSNHNDNVDSGAGLTLVDDLDDELGDGGEFGMGFTMVDVNGMGMMGIEGAGDESASSSPDDVAPKKSKSDSTAQAATTTTKKKTKAGGAGTAGGANGAPGAGLERRKSGHQRHSSSSARLPPMPEERELEDEQDGSGVSVSDSPGSQTHAQVPHSQFGHGMEVDSPKMNGHGLGHHMLEEDASERGRSGVRGVRNGSDGFMHHHQQIQHQQQQQSQQMGYAAQMGW